MALRRGLILGVGAGGSHREERTGSPGARGRRVLDSQGTQVPLTMPLRVAGSHPPSISLRAPASGRAGLGVVGFPLCVWEIRF